MRAGSRTARAATFRRWYGNYELVVDWENDGDVNQMDDADGPRSRNNYNRDRTTSGRGITWSRSTQERLRRSARRRPGFIFDAKRLGSVHRVRMIDWTFSAYLQFADRLRDPAWTHCADPRLHPGHLVALPIRRRDAS